MSEPKPSKSLENWSIEMKLLICNSKSWFSLDSAVSDVHHVKEISLEKDLTPELILDFQPDFVFFTHWNWKVSERIHENNKCVVFHTAPLPYGRGGSPIQNLIINGFDMSPVCAIKMTSDLDAGPIYASLDISLEGDLGSIFSRISDAINALIFEIVTNNPVPIAQSGKSHTFKRLGEKDNEIPLGMSLKKIYDQVRMLDHEDYPSAYINYGDVRLEFSNAQFNNRSEGAMESLELTCRMTK